MNHFATHARKVAALLAAGLVAVFGAAPATAQSGTDEEGNPIEEIVVTGIRGSLKAAINMKRDADNIVDALVAEDIGKFPDQNLAESLQRITGVAIDRQRGEGTLVSIRGLGPEFVRVQVNGRTALSGAGIARSAGGIGGLTQNRAFYFDSLQSELVQSVEVYKSTQANLFEGGLGGTVNIRTRRPFDNGGNRIIAGGGLVTHNDLADDEGYRVSGVFSDTFADRTWGFLIGVAADDRTVREDWFGLPDYEVKVFNNAVDENGNALPPCTLITISSPTAGCGYTAGNIRMGIVEDERERLNVSSAIQFRPREDIDLTIDLQYNDFTRDYLDIQIPLRSQAGLAAGAREVYMNEDQIVTYFRTDRARPRPFPYDFETQTEQEQIAANLKLTPNDQLEVNLDISWAKSDTEELQTSTYYDIAGGVPVTWDIRGGFIPEVSVDADLTDPSLYTFSLLSDNDRNSEDEELQMRADVTYSFDDGTALTGGISYRKRERQYDTTILSIGTRFGNFLNEPLTNTVYHDLPVSDPFSGISGSRSWPQNWLWADPDAVRQQFLVDRRDEIPADQFEDANALSGEEFFVEEKILAGYLMLNVDGNVGNTPFSGNVGVRVVHVDRDSTGNVQPVNAVVFSESAGVFVFDLLPAEPQTFSSKDTEILPALNLRFDLREDLVARFAWGKTMTQPSFSQLNPGGTKLASTRTVNEGNPFLEPYVAQQVDLTLEWYPTDESIVAVAGFYKDVDSFITTVTLVEDFIDPVTNAPVPDPESGGNVRLQYNGPRNEEGAWIAGVEFAFQYSFVNLPAPWDGFGVQFNHTWVDTDAEFTNPNSGASFDVPGLSPHTTNIVGFYEKNRFSGRIAWNRRDEFLWTVSDTRSNPRFTKEYTQLDASVSFNVTENVKVVLEGINLTDENVEQFNIVGPVSDLKQLRTVSNTGRRYQAGIRVTL